MSFRHPTRPSLTVLLVLAACGVDHGPTDVTGRTHTLAPRSTVSGARAVAAGVAVTQFASGFQGPRGLAFGPDGALYVGEAGTGGGAATTSAQCAQVIPPIGPYTNGSTARISRVDAHGQVTTVAVGLPSSRNAMGDVTGVSALAFQGGQLYALLAGGGCDHGSPNVPAGVARVSLDGAWSVIANLTAYQAANPVARPPIGDFEPSGSWYSMIQSGASLVAIEPNHGEIVQVNPRTGAVERIADISASQGHAVPTVVAERQGAYYVSALGTFPVQPGSQRVLRITRAGDVSVAATGFTAVLGIDFDHSGRMYVLESTTAPGFPVPFTGRVVRVDKRGAREVLVDGLFFPTGMRFGPDGALYVANVGFGPPIPGEILRVEVPGANEP